MAQLTPLDVLSARPVICTPSGFGTRLWTLLDYCYCHFAHEQEATGQAGEADIDYTRRGNHVAIWQSDGQSVVLPVHQEVGLGAEARVLPSHVEATRARRPISYHFGSSGNYCIRTNSAFSKLAFVDNSAEQQVHPSIGYL